MLEGPKSDLRGFLAACDQLLTNVEYLTLNRSLEASDTALNHARELFGKGMSRLEEEFKVLLTNHRLVLEIGTFVPLNLVLVFEGDGFLLGLTVGGICCFVVFVVSQQILFGSWKPCRFLGSTCQRLHIMERKR